MGFNRLNLFFLALPYSKRARLNAKHNIFAENSIFVVFFCLIFCCCCFCVLYFHNIFQCINVFSSLDVLLNRSVGCWLLVHRFNFTLVLTFLIKCAKVICYEISGKNTKSKVSIKQTVLQLERDAHRKQKTQNQN